MAAIDINQPEESFIITAVLYAVFAILIFYLIFYTYKQFVANSKDNFIAGQQQERTDTVVDFDLRDEIQQLENMQQKVLNKLSRTTNI